MLSIQTEIVRLINNRVDIYDISNITGLSISNIENLNRDIFFKPDLLKNPKYKIYPLNKLSSIYRN